MFSQLHLDEHYTFNNSKILPVTHFRGPKTGDVDPENALGKPLDPEKSYLACTSRGFFSRGGDFDHEKSLQKTLAVFPATNNGIDM
jgi:hypothetical protein